MADSLKKDFESAEREGIALVLESLYLKVSETPDFSTGRSSTTEIKAAAPAAQTEKVSNEDGDTKTGQMTFDLPLSAELATVQTEDAHDDIRNLLQAAQQKCSSGDYKDVEHLCYRILELDRKNTDAMLILSAVYFILKRFLDSEKCSRLAIQINPGLAEAYSNLGNVLRRRKQMTEAIQHYNRAVLLKPYFVEGYINLGATFHETGQIDQAIDAYALALYYDPNLHELRNDLGNLLRSMGRLEEARMCFQTVVDMVPDYAPAWNNLGCIYNDAQMPWLAIHHFEKAAALQPDFVNAQVNLGTVLQQVKAYNLALVPYLQAYSLQPSNSTINGKLGSLYEDLGSLETAMSYYRDAIALASNIYPDAHNNLGCCFQRKGLMKEAEECYRTALEQCPTHPEALANIANIIPEESQRGTGHCTEKGLAGLG